MNVHVENVCDLMARNGQMLDEIERLRGELQTARQVLRDIAGSECIPTPELAWRFCRDTAAAALPKD